MAYRIVYGSDPPIIKQKRPVLRLQILTALFLLLFTVSVRSIWPEGTAKLQQILIPGELTITQVAMTDMVQSLRDGASLDDAVTAFCHQVITYGKP